MPVRNPSEPMSIEIQEAISGLIDGLHLPNGANCYKHLAGSISAAVDKDPPYTWRYIQSVHKGTIKAGAPLKAAVSSLLAHQYGIPSQISQAQFVTVLAEPGTIVIGSYVNGQSKLCPLCGILFVTDHPRRKYCSICRPPRKRVRK